MVLGFFLWVSGVEWAWVVVVFVFLFVVVVSLVLVYTVFSPHPCLNPRCLFSFLNYKMFPSLLVGFCFSFLLVSLLLLVLLLIF